MHLKLKLNLKISVKFSVFWNLPENLCPMFFRDFKLIFSFSHAKLLRDFLINCTRTFSFQALTVSPLIFFKYRFEHDVSFLGNGSYIRNFYLLSTSRMIVQFVWKPLILFWFHGYLRETFWQKIDFRYYYSLENFSPWNSLKTNQKDWS